MTRRGTRAARVEDVHDPALGMPHVTVSPGTQNRPVYQVGGKLAMVQDESSPFFTTAHFDEHTSD